MGIREAYDLEAWRDWQRSRRPVQGAVRRLRGTVRPSAAPSAVPLRLHVVGRPRVLVGLDARSTSNLAAVLRPVEGLVEEGIAVLSSVPVDDLLPPGEWRVRQWAPTAPELADVHSVWSAGHYLPAGEAAYAFSVRRDLPFGVVQHGLITPFAPPLPYRAHALVWTAEDGDYWRAGRSDITVRTVGSQLLADARRPRADQLVTERAVRWHDRSPVYLGQLHGIELNVWQMAAAAYLTCRRTGAVYRPHPSERDALSRLLHRLWRAGGITVDSGVGRIADLEAPLIGVFSTGILEAAASGLPAYVDYPRPPAWLMEFWERNRMGRVGGAPTAPPPAPETNPAAAVAEWARTV